MYNVYKYVELIALYKEFNIRGFPAVASVITLDLVERLRMSHPFILANNINIITVRNR